MFDIRKDIRIANNPSYCSRSLDEISFAHRTDVAGADTGKKMTEYPSATGRPWQHGRHPRAERSCRAGTRCPYGCPDGSARTGRVT